MVGDVLYDPDVARRMLPWLQRLAAFGVQTTVGDPGRPVSTEHFASMELLEEVELPAIFPSEVFWEHFGAVRASVWRAPHEIEITRKLASRLRMMRAAPVFNTSSLLAWRFAVSTYLW